MSGLWAMIGGALFFRDVLKATDHHARDRHGAGTLVADMREPRPDRFRQVRGQVLDVGHKDLDRLDVFLASAAGSDVVGRVVRHSGDVAATGSVGGHSSSPVTFGASIEYSARP